MSKKKLDFEIYEKFYYFEDDKIRYELLFNKYSDLFNLDSNTKIPLLTTEAKNKFNSVIETGFNLKKLKLYLMIENKEGHSNDEIKELLNQNLELELLSTRRHIKLTKIKSLCLLIGGIVFLLISYFAASKLNTKKIINDIINISGTLLVWEGCYTFIVERTAKSYIMLKFYNLIKEINIK